MGIGLRIFFVQDDGTLKRFPAARFERLMNQDPNECLPEYVEKRVRYVFVSVELENREPVEIIGIGYNILTLDSEGKVDEAELKQEMRLLIDSLPLEPSKPIASNIIDAEPRFLHRRYINRYQWESTPEIEQAVFEAVFGNNDFEVK